MVLAKLAYFASKTCSWVVGYNTIDPKVCQETCVARRKSVDVTILLLRNYYFCSKRVFNFKITINIHYFKSLYSYCIWNVGTAMTSKGTLPMKYLHLPFTNVQFRQIMRLLKVERIKCYGI